MHLYLWVAALFVILAECGCRTIQSKLDQQGQRVSQMLERQQNDSVILEELKQVIGKDEGKESAMQNLTGSLTTVNNASVQYVDTQFGPNWIVIFQRIDNLGNFGRPWKDYRDGFGTVGQNFWLGLEKMHQLTKDSPYELAVEMTDYNYGDESFARYDRFEIGSEAQEYPIVKLGTYSGTAGDGLAGHKSKTFSTYDSGKYIEDSKQTGNGGWWFHSGEWSSFFTGVGENSSEGWNGMYWTFKLSSARMMIRAI